MTINTFLHFLCILSLAIGVITFILTLLNKKINLFRKINSSFYLFVLCAFIYFSEYIVSFLKKYYYSVDSYDEIFVSILNVLSLVAIITVLLGTNLKNNEKFQKYIFISIELIIFVICVSLVWNLFYSNSKNVYLFPVLLISLILTETYLINSTETLKIKSSIVYYFTANIVFSLFWIVETILLFSSLSMTTALIPLLAIVLIISLSSILLGIITVKKENKND